MLECIFACGTNKVNLSLAWVIFNVPVIRRCSAVRLMVPFVWPSAVMSRVSVQISELITPFSSLFFNHSRCTMKFFSAGFFMFTFLSISKRFLASVTQSILKPSPWKSVKFIASFRVTGPNSISCSVNANPIAPSAPPITPCVSAVKVDRTTTLTHPTMQSRKWHCTSKLVPPVQLDWPSRRKLIPFRARPSTSPSSVTSLRNPVSEWTSRSFAQIMCGYFNVFGCFCVHLTNVFSRRMCKNFGFCRNFCKAIMYTSMSNRVSRAYAKDMSTDKYSWAVVGGASSSSGLPVTCAPSIGLMAFT